MRTRVKHVYELEMPRDFQWSGFRSFPAMRTRVKHVQGLEMPRDFQWSVLRSFPAMRTRAKHVQGPEMPRDFSMVWFQFFSRHADTSQARARTGNAARFSVESGLSSFPAMRTRVKHLQGLEMQRNFLQSCFRLFQSPCGKYLEHSRISNAARFFLSGAHLLCFISPNSH